MEHREAEDLAEQIFLWLGYEVAPFGRRSLDEHKLLNDELSKTQSPMRNAPDFFVWRADEGHSYVDVKSTENDNASLLLVNCDAAHRSLFWAEAHPVCFVWVIRGKLLRMELREYLEKAERKPGRNGKGDFFQLPMAAGHPLGSIVG